MTFIKLGGSYYNIDKIEEFVHDKGMLNVWFRGMDLFFPDPDRVLFNKLCGSVDIV